MMGLGRCVGFSLVAESRSYSLVVVHGLLCAVASLVAEHQLRSTGSAVVVHGLICSVASGIFPDKGSKPATPGLQVGSLPLSHQSSPVVCLFKLLIVSFDAQNFQILMKSNLSLLSCLCF